MRRKNGLALLAAVSLVSVMMISGCGKPAGETAGGKASVRFMVGGSAAELEQYQKAVDAFNKESKTAQVELVGVPGDNYNEKVMTQLSSKTAPDCFYAEEASYGELNKSGVLLDISSYLRDEKSMLKTADIPERILESYTYQDKITGVPVDCNPMVIYYNEDLFNEMGIKSPQDYVKEGTWNFKTLQSISEQLRDASKIGFVYENWWGPLYSFLVSNGESLYLEDGKSSNFGSERVKAGLSYLEQNIKSKAFTYAGSLTSGESPDTLFMSGQAGMLYAGRWFVSDFKDIGFTYDVAPFPYYEEPTQAIAAMPATPMVINKATKNADAVWEFVSYYCGTNGQNLRMEGAGNAVPTVNNLDEIVLTGTPENAQYFLDAKKTAMMYPQTEALHPGLTDTITGEVEKLLVNEQDLDTAVENIEAAVNKELGSK